MQCIYNSHICLFLTLAAFLRFNNQYQNSVNLMNFERVMQESSFNNDYQRLIQLCGSYGLNEEETNQIIYDFKNGSFAHEDQSIDQSFHQSIQNHQYSQQHSDTSRNHEQYSFKHQKNLQLPISIPSHHDSLQQPSPLSQNKPTDTSQLISQFMIERKQFELGLYRKLQQENQRLRQQLKSKQEQVSILIKLKSQDADVIMGLKDAIRNFAKAIEEKDQVFKILNDKYDKLKSEADTLSSQRNSKVQMNHQQSMSSIQQRRSLPKQNIVVQQDIKNMYKKPVQKYIKQISNRVSSKSQIEKVQNSQQNRENIMKNEQMKRSGVDIGKYKGMIEKLRNSYQFR